MNAKFKKAAATASTLALAVCLSIGGTYAYLTAETEEVTNTFTVGKVAITLDEADTDEYGEEKLISDSPAPRVTANDYKLIPGHSYLKDPTVHLAAGSEACYVYVDVYNGLANAISDIKEQMRNKGWTNLDDGIWYQAVDADTAAEGTDLVVFDNFTVAGDKVEDDLKAFDGKTITITAYAVQKDGFSDAASAWEACFAGE